MSPEQARAMLDEPMADGPPDTTRFRVIRPLGSGGMGVVYAAEDTTTGERVALKTLRESSGLNLLLLKNEFRALSDLSHPNLAALHELHAEGETAFLTMELIEGQDFIKNLRGPNHETGVSWVDGKTRTLGVRPGDTLAPTESDTPPPESTPLPTTAFGPLRATLAQIAEGLAVLHGARRLHRDVKPSNVMVTPEGRAVMLDFGLVAELEDAAASVTAGQGIAGSVPYMSPEQAVGAELTPASDWYAFGAMLYEALCGHPPFTGAVAEVFRAKASARPIPPSDLVDGLPLDLEALCLALLETDPAARPTGAQVLERLGHGDVAQRVAAARREQTRLVGRAEPLATLQRALADTRGGQAVAVHVRGRSGMGKSTLCSHFLDGLSDALVLRARCYERDSVPFKALDPLVDQLSRWIVALPTADATALLPRYVRSLARLFPVLQQIPAIVESGQRTAAAADPREERRRAFGALRELLARVAERQTVVVHLDDLQWGDQDSGELLRELLRRPDPPSMLLIASFRIENEETSPLLQLLRRSAAEEGVRTIDIEPLDRDLSLQLARQILQERGVAPDQLEHSADEIAREGAGSPFFVTELAHWGGGSGARLDGLVRARAAELPKDVGRLLQTIALVAVPIARRVALDAAGVKERRTESMSVLENGRFIRGDGPGPDECVECYHDRIREAVVDGMDEATRRATHVAIAQALEGAGSDDAELLTEHWLLGGRNIAAARQARIAVDQALEALAFDRAAAMLRLLLELDAPDETERRTLLERLGRALTHAGRSLEAADVFEQAATLAQGSDRRGLLHEVAVLRLGAGQFDRGRALFYELLDAVQIRVPRSRVALIIGALWARLRTRIRGLSFVERDDDDVAPDERERIELLRGAGVGTITTDQFLAFNLLARFIPWALNRGTRSQQVWALTAESFVAQIEPGGRKRGDTAFAAAEALAEQIGNSEALATACMYRGVALIQLGFIKSALVSVRRGARLLEDHVAGGTSNLGWARLFLYGGLGQAGRIDECVRRTSELVEDARNRGDLALEIHVLVGSLVIPDLLLDRPDAADLVIDDALVRWDRSVPSCDLMHFYGLMCRTRVLLYRGETETPLRQLDEYRKKIRRSGALQSGANIRYYRSMEGAACVAAARIAPPAARTRLLRRADKLAERLIGHGPMGEATGGILGAGAALARGRPDVARARLDLAERVAIEQDMGLFAVCAKVHRAHLFGDAAQLQAAYDELGALGVRDPARWTQSMAPLLDVPPAGNEQGGPAS